MRIRAHGRGMAARALVFFAAVAGGAWLCDDPRMGRAAPPMAANPAPETPSSDYAQRVVAYIYGSIPVTRQDLGEYLIARRGADNVELLTKKKIIEHACNQHHITVTDAEVEASILADCETVNIKKAEFVNTVIKKNFGKSLYEWKEDIVKPRLLLSKLVAHQIPQTTEEELRKSFESVYGRKVNVRIIIWSKGEEEKAKQEYDVVRKDEQGFDRIARSQTTTSLASSGGKIKPIAHFAGVHPEVEQAAFTLKPGEVSQLIVTPDGSLALKVDGYIDADTSAKFEDKREGLSKAVFDKKVAAEIPVVFKKLNDEAKPEITLNKSNDQRSVAIIYGTISITREDLGEFLIARFGLDSVEFLVNRKIIDHVCEQHGIKITDADVELSIQADCDAINVKKEDFIKNVVEKNLGKKPSEWKEDMIKPRLMLTKLVKDHIVVTDEDLKKAFEAAYGEKRECRIIIWPDKEERIALQEYDSVRKDEQGFDRKARGQANSALAANGGKVQPIARNSGVNVSVEHAAFSLQPGEVSSIIKTPEGLLVLKMDKVVPPDASVKLEDKHVALTKEVFDKKVAAEIPNLFKRMREEAKPVFILKKPNDPNKLVEEVEQEILPAGGMERPPK